MGVVLKYGGSSVASTEYIKQIAAYIKTVREEEPVVVVVSAMGNTTNQLLELAKQVSTQASKRELDTLLATGEQQTIALLSLALQGSGVKAISLTGAQAGFITTPSHTKGVIMDVKIERVLQHLRDDCVVVVAGFQGITESGDITTLGRGGSDTSAVALAAKLGYRCEIYTDVDGIYSVDPRQYKDAKKLDTISFSEMMEMSILGAGVMETRAVELAKKYNVELYVAKSLSPKGSGTYIMNEHYLFEDKPITGLSVTNNVSMVTLEGMNNNNQVVASIFNEVSANNINLDMISQNIDNNNNVVVSFSIHSTDLEELLEVISSNQTLFQDLHVETTTNLVKLSLIGVGMASHFGVASRVFQTLAAHNIPFYHVSTSEISISCTIDQANEAQAVEVLAKGISPMNLRYSKYHGLGNDFVFVDAADVQDLDAGSLAITLCDRHTGIGADGLIIVKQDPLEMIYYNSDGSRAKMCGNGIRCFANYCVDNQLVTSDDFTVSTLAGLYQVSVINKNPFTVSVTMGKANFTPSAIPVITELSTFINQEQTVYDKTFTISSVFMGTIHTTVEVEDLDQLDKEYYGKALQELPLFPDKTNVNFYQVLDQNNIKIQTYERGAGLTLACGTGATAVYAVLQHTHHHQTPITFHLPLGTMTLHQSANSDIIMTGPATFVFAGDIGVII